MSSEPPPLSLSVGIDALRPLVAAVVEETLARLDRARSAVPEPRLAYSEAEAAALLGLATHQLRDERRRGRIAASTVVGRRIRYTRDDLLGYLTAGRSNGTGAVR